MINQSLQITDLIFSDDGNFLAIGFNQGKIELWGKTDSLWHMQWNVKYTCLPVLVSKIKSLNGDYMNLRIV